MIGFFTPHPRRQPVDVVTPDPTFTPLPTPTPAPLRVYVCGEVANPAVYELRPGSLVDDAVRAAGGPTSRADLNQINLAQVLNDQQRVHVPGRSYAPTPPPVSGGEAAADTTALIDINTASAGELEALPNVGPATARSIVEYRDVYGPFAAIEEIMNVTGIGPATFEEIRNLIVASDEG
jgi:competence protein ComEA